MKTAALALALALAAACEASATAPPSRPPPTANVAPAPPPPPPPAPTCIAKDASIADARLIGGLLVACYRVPQSSDDAVDCWQFDLATSLWSFATRKPHADVAPPPPQVTVTTTSARACELDGSDCKTIPLSGIQLGPDDRLEGATNSDRSLVAVWGTGPVLVFDASGQRLATIKPWWTEMAGKGNGPSSFREAHVLGSTIEVRIADTPISSAIRLYDTRGHKLADVFGAKPMEDSDPPLALGNSRYAFVSIDSHTLVITDVATGRQLASHPLPGEPLAPSVLMRTRDGNVAGVVGTTAVRFDIATGQLSSFAGPVCAK